MGAPKGPRRSRTRQKGWIRKRHGYIAAYRNADGREVSRTFDTKAEAKTWLDFQLTQMYSGVLR